MGFRFGVALCSLVVLGCFLGPCTAQALPQTVILGGAAGWTDVSNINYTLFMSTISFKAGDTLRFNNTDVKDHNVLQMDTQGDYDACNANNNTGWTVNAGDFYDMLFTDPATRVWIIDTQYCMAGQKVEFTVLEPDGTAAPPDSAADPPSLNAPPLNPDSPPSPPAPPLTLGGGPMSSAGAAQPGSLRALVIVLVVACYLASSATWRQ